MALKEIEGGKRKINRRNPTDYKSWVELELMRNVGNVVLLISKVVIPAGIKKKAVAK